MQTLYCRQHTATYQMNDANKQRSSNSTKHERWPPEDGQTIVTETCRVLMMCFTNIFNNLVFEMWMCFKKSAWVGLNKINKLYMFRTVPLSIIRSFSLYTQQCYMSCRFADSLRAGSVWNCSSILILLDSCQQNSMTYTTAVCTVKNSWWWTEEMSETCKVSFQE